jgi:hypothetical protein
MSTVDGRTINVAFLHPPKHPRRRQSTYVFPTEHPARADWRWWMEFWTTFTGHGGQLHCPLGEWSTRRTGYGSGSTGHAQTQCIESAATKQQYASVHLLQEYGHARSTSMPATLTSSLSFVCQRTFLSFPRAGSTEGGSACPWLTRSTVTLLSGSSCALLEVNMWKYLKEGEVDVGWIRDALVNGTLIGVTDGSYDRIKAQMISRAGLVLTCTACHRTLRGSFYEISPRAGSYRGELLGLVAIHTLILAIAKFYSLLMVSAKICCDNMSALNQSSKSRKQVSPGIKHSDLHRAIRTYKCTINMVLRYEHVRSHQDRYRPWSLLTLEEQLNVICDKLAHGLVSQYLQSGFPRIRAPQLFPLEKVAIILDGTKQTTDAGAEVRNCLGKEEAIKFYTKPTLISGGTNKGGLGWLQERFNQVSWSSLDASIHLKPDMFQVWLAKQCIRICATRLNMARIQGLLDDNCTNCCHPGGTNDHLNHCPDPGRTLLFRDRVPKISRWMYEQSRTDAELAYWVGKYLIF